MGNAATDAGAAVRDAAGRSIAVNNAATGVAQAGVTDAARTEGDRAIAAGTAAGTGVIDASKDANTRLDPYASTGATAARTLGEAIAPGGSLMKNFSSEDFRADPGYLFRLQQGQQANDRVAAARGAAGGGGAAKAMARYTQGVAAQEFAAAAERDRMQKNDQFSHLDSISRSGQTAATTQGGNTMGAVRYAGDANVRGAEFAGNLNNDAAKTAAGYGVDNARFTGSTDVDAGKYQGDVGMRSAEYQGNILTDTAVKQAGNTMDTGRYVGDGQVGSAGAQATGTLGRAAAINGMLGSIGSAANSVITGGMSVPGKAFSLGGALRGAAAPPPPPTVRR